MKKFWKYTLITILLLIGLFCVAILYLFFVPNSNLFGIMYISLNENVYSPAYSVTENNLITITSRSYPVRFVTSANEFLSIRVYANSLGFVLEDNSKAEIKDEITSNGLNIEISEPHGACVYNNSFIEIRIPEGSNIDISLKNQNASTTFNVADLSINDLSYSTTNGDFSMLSGTINGELNLNLNRATFTLSADVVTNENTVTLNLTSGSFVARDSVLDNVYIDNNDRGVIILGDCNYLHSRNDLAGGRIEATRVGMIELNSSDTDVYIDNLEGGSIELTKSGEISIDTVSGDPYLTTSSGSIYIKNLVSNANLSTTSNGSITVDLAHADITAETTYGDIDITFISGDGDSTVNFIDATTSNGRIDLYNVDRTLIRIADRGRAYVYFNDVNGTSVIDGENGEVYMQFNSNNNLTLTTSSTSGNVNVYYEGIPYGEPYTGRTANTFTINAGGNNSIDVSTNSGNLRVRDNTFAEMDR